MILYYTENTKETASRLMDETGLNHCAWLGIRDEGRKFIFLNYNDYAAIFTGSYPLAKDKHLTADDFVKKCIEICPKKGEK